MYTSYPTTSSKPSLALRARAELELRRRQRARAGAPSSAWSESGGVYVNRDTGKRYQWHHEDEKRFLESDVSRYGLAKGGEGGGKSVLGIIKTLERLRRGMSGIMVSPDLPHFKRSLWMEFKRWCPWEDVIPSQRYRGRFDWEPAQPFMLAFQNGASLLCGGIEDPGSWEGPNVNFFYFDEARKARTPDGLKVLDGRIRITGPNGEPPQGWIATTPRKHWLYEYFGPLVEDDPRASFKENALVIDLLTIDNERAGNLTPGFTEQRAQSLDEAEARVLLKAEWEDIDDVDRFLPSMAWWDSCLESLPPLSPHEPVVLAADAGVSNDCFGLVGVTRHPADNDRVAVRFVQVWVPRRGHQIDFEGTPESPGPERVIRALGETFNVLELTYDAYQLHQMSTRIRNEGRIMVREFPQGGDRLEADKGLLDLIMSKRLSHDGNAELRTHVDNADRKTDPETRKLRIVKRVPSLKVDLAVALSMSAYRCLKLPL